ncbi:YqgE/AlgH family protein [Sagittula sp. NFXS13]|uniref:YqgE/AlgH family protein n=1 Tax=Sagittula sp. NFXS13 TaxID=2819095 RepID=UPI0032DE414F
MTGEITDKPTELTGRLLIAMPGMEDPRFEWGVVLLCDHSADGAMGLIINKPAQDIDMSALLTQLDIENTADLGALPVRYGGPVEMGRGFVLHSPDYASAVTTLEVTDDLSMTATLDVLEDLGKGQGPEKWLMMLGYAGWGPGQLEHEIAENAWLVCEAAPSLIFGLTDTDKWEAALETLGVSPMMLSSEGGRA